MTPAPVRHVQPETLHFLEDTMPRHTTGMTMTVGELRDAGYWDAAVEVLHLNSAKAALLGRDHEMQFTAAEREALRLELRYGTAF